MFLLATRREVTGKHYPKHYDIIQASLMHGLYLIVYDSIIWFQKDLKTCLTDYTRIVPWLQTQHQCLLLRSRCACHSKVTISENLITDDLKPFQLQFRGQVRYCNMFIDSLQHASNSGRFPCLKRPQGVESCDQPWCQESHAIAAWCLFLTLPWPSECLQSMY